jgi:hypothetical protein
VDEVRRDITSSTEFTQDEKDFLYFCVDRFRTRQEVDQSFSKTFQKILPYAIATAFGYGARIAQEKLGEYVEEGKTKAREEFSRQRESIKTSF